MNDYKRVEEKWQKYWEEKGTFLAKTDDIKEPYYILVEFPYPSGSGLHVGHVRYLQKTKTFADYSIVLLNSDKSVKSIKGDSRPINNENDRAEVLMALSCVDFVVMFDEDSPAELLDEIKPDVYTKGADYTMDTLPERDIMIKNGTRVEFIDFVQGKSTTNIIEKINNKE